MISLPVIEYSRPVLPLLQQPKQTAVIQSIFRRAINISLDGTILSLLSADLPRMPNAIRLSPEAIERLQLHLRPGALIQSEDGALIFPDIASILALSGVPVWEPRPAIQPDQWCKQIVTHHLQTLACFLYEQAPPMGLAQLVGPLLLGKQAPQTPLARMALPALYSLIAASQQQSIEGIQKATRALAGLGPGLTPSGDDVLCGFSAAMLLCSSQLGTSQHFCEELAISIAIAAQARTTALSSTLLRHAAQGEVAESLGGLLLAMALPTTEAQHVLRAAEQLLAGGATSGGDTLLGILLMQYPRSDHGRLPGLGSEEYTCRSLEY